MKLYSVYDKKSMIYGQIMTCQDEIQAKRLFERAVNDDETMLFHYPDIRKILFWLKSVILMKKLVLSLLCLCLNRFLKHRHVFQSKNK